VPLEHLGDRADQRGLRVPSLTWTWMSGDAVSAVVRDARNLSLIEDFLVRSRKGAHQGQLTTGDGVESRADTGHVVALVSASRVPAASPSRSDASAAEAQRK
jgi:hypothetical protein